MALVENQGQWKSGVRFVARRGGMGILLEPTEFWLQVERSDPGGGRAGVALRLVFEGASKDARWMGEGRQRGTHNFFLGNDPRGWRTHVPSYDSVLCRGLYEGIDLRFREEAGKLEYDLLASPGGDLSAVRIRCEGIEGLEVDCFGALRMATALGDLRQSPPLAWEEAAGGARAPLRCAFRVLPGGRYGFDVEGADGSNPVVVDPGLEWSTFLGSAGWDQVAAAAVDASGATTVVGFANQGFPTTPGAYDSTFGGGATPNFPGADVFVSRIDATGTALIYSTYLGGSGQEWGMAVALDAFGDAIATGTTYSFDFPTTAGAFSTNCGGCGPGYGDVFVTSLDPTGSALLFSTFLGGGDHDLAMGIAVDFAGQPTLAGTTFSPNFPTTSSGFDTTFNGGGSLTSAADLFATRLNANGSGLVYSTFLGSPGHEETSDLAVDPSGAATLVGYTSSPTFPVTAGAYDTTFASGPSTSSNWDALVSRLNPAGSSLLSSTFLGGSDLDQAFGLAVDALGAPTVVGATASANFPTTPGAYDTTATGWSGFVTRLSANGSSLAFSTFLGGTVTQVSEVALDASGSTVAAGATRDLAFPTTPGAFDTIPPVPAGTFGNPPPNFDLFVTRLDPTGAQAWYSTFLGGDTPEGATALAVDGTGAATLVGATTSPNFPTTSGAFDPTLNSTFYCQGLAYCGDGFIARLDLLPTGVTKYASSTPGCAGPLAAGVTSWPQVGNAAFAVTCSNGPANGAGTLAVSLAEASPPFLLAGALVAIDPVVLIPLPVASDALGACQEPIPIPADPTLSGGQAFVQFFWPDPCAPGAVSASNALAIEIQP